MPCAHARQPARNDLAALRDKALQQTNVAVGDRVDLLRAELADLLAPEELAAARAAARSAGRTRSDEVQRQARMTGRGRRWCGMQVRVAQIDCVLLVSSAMLFPSQIRCAFTRSRPAVGVSETTRPVQLESEAELQRFMMRCAMPGHLAIANLLRAET